MVHTAVAPLLFLPPSRLTLALQSARKTPLLSFPASSTLVTSAPLPPANSTSQGQAAEAAAAAPETLALALNRPPSGLSGALHPACETPSRVTCASKLIRTLQNQIKLLQNQVNLTLQGEGGAAAEAAGVAAAAAAATLTIPTLNPKTSSPTQHPMQTRLVSLSCATPATLPSLDLTPSLNSTLLPASTTLALRSSRISKSIHAMQRPPTTIPLPLRSTCGTSALPSARKTPGLSQPLTHSPRKTLL